MKNLAYFITTILVLFTLNSFSQSQFENPGFEEWQNITDQIEEPVNWSTVKTCIPENLATFAPVTVNKEDENPHSGNYCIHVFSVEAAFNIIATGNLTNGRVYANTNPSLGYMFIDRNNSEWNCPLSTRPDSLTGWYKCSPMEGDHGVVKAIISSDSATLPSPDSLNWIAFAQFDLPGTAVNEWKRFSVPFTYLSENNPKYILCVITSSNGVSAVAGSEIWVDDLYLVPHPNSVEEISENDVNIYSLNGRLNVYVKTDNHKKASLKVVDLTGKTVFKELITTGKKYTVDINIPKSTYIIVVNVGTKTITKKIIL
jgi:hypothetical protein